MEQDDPNDNSNPSPLSSLNASSSSTTSTSGTSSAAASTQTGHDAHDESNDSTQQIPNPRFMPPNECDQHANEIFTVCFVQKENDGFSGMFNLLFEFQENIGKTLLHK